MLSFLHSVQGCISPLLQGYLLRKLQLWRQPLQITTDLSPVLSTVILYIALSIRGSVKFNKNSE